MVQFEWNFPLNREAITISDATHTPDSRSAMSDLVALIPCYNPGPRVRPVVESLLKIHPNIIVVDDGSTDGSVEELRDLPVRIVSMTPNRGKGYALIAGYRAALEDETVRCVASLDADGQHAPEELPGLYAAFKEGKGDLLIGSRDFGGGNVPLRSRFGNVVTVRVMGWLLGKRLPDTQSGYRILSRRFIEAILPHVEGGRYETEMELLARAIQGDYVVLSPSIRTIYEEGNQSSHFQKVRDSWRIYKTLMRAARRRRASR